MTLSPVVIGRVNKKAKMLSLVQSIDNQLVKHNLKISLIK